MVSFKAYSCLLLIKSIDAWADSKKYLSEDDIYISNYTPNFNQGLSTNQNYKFFKYEFIVFGVMMIIFYNLILQIFSKLVI